MPSDDIPVEITYHRQKSSTGRIRSGKIQLRISSLVSRREQQRHIDHLLEKLLGQYDRHQEEKIPLSLAHVFEEGELLLSTGVEYQVEVKQASVSKYKVEKVGTRLVVLQPVDALDFDADLAEQALWTFLRKDQVPVLKQRLNVLREGWLEEPFSQVKLKQVMSRWGSCDKHTGVIMLSVKLLLVEPKLLDYVAVHELAHLRHADHSDLFWSLVERKMPDWKVQRKRLRQYE